MLGLSFIYHGIIAIVALKVENYSNDDKFKTWHYKMPKVVTQGLWT